MPPATTRFLSAIRAEADEDLPRLAFADYIEEQGDSDRASLIRVQCELDPIRHWLDDPHVQELLEREAELLDHFEGYWTAVLGWRRPSVPLELRRGFVEHVCLKLDELLTYGHSLFDAHPTIRELTVYNIGDRLVELSTSPFLNRLERLELLDHPPAGLGLISFRDTFGAVPHIRLWAHWSDEFLRYLLDHADPGRAEAIEFVVTNPWDGNITREFGSRCQRVRVVNANLDRYPLHGIISAQACAGRMPDGTTALVVVDDCKTRGVVVRFDRDGQLKDHEEFSNKPSYRSVAKWAEQEYQLTPCLIRVLPFNLWLKRVPELSLQPWTGNYNSRAAIFNSYPLIQMWKWRQQGRFLMRWGSQHTPFDASGLPV